MTLKQTITIPEPLAGQLEQIWHGLMMPNRTVAILHLMRLGVAQQLRERPDLVREGGK